MDSASYLTYSSPSTTSPPPAGIIRRWAYMAFTAKETKVVTVLFILNILSFANLYKIQGNQYHTEKDATFSIIDRK